jgi:hypothetical protein
MNSVDYHCESQSGIVVSTSSSPLLVIGSGILDVSYSFLVKLVDLQLRLLKHETKILWHAWTNDHQVGLDDLSDWLTLRRILFI